jgi:uncharacterized protein (TIGR00375 family)
MRVIADLHIHSKYSRATSNRMDVETIAQQAKIKGLNIIGTGDFTHPKWSAELKSKLVKEGDLYVHNGVHFVPQTEISSIYTDGDSCRKIHNCIMCPDLETAEQVTEWLKTKGRVDYDGRPIFKLPCPELVEKVMEINKDNFVFPAHIWTPWFSLFGSESGFDRIEDCYKDQTKNIHALETGLSSDPEMNWRLSALDRFALISNSDCHSPWPYRLGREANVFELSKPSYYEMISAIKSKNPKQFLYTIEVDPAYGKYHFDGHRNCNVEMSPEEAIKQGNICSVCKKKLTLGVLHRVEELADRPVGFVPKGAIPFKKILPIQEIIATVNGSPVFSTVVARIYNKLIERFKTEMAILLEASFEQLREVVEENMAKAILLNRENRIHVKPGYDNTYGVPSFGDEIKVKKRRQATIAEF